MRIEYDGHTHAHTYKENVIYLFIPVIIVGLSLLNNFFFLLFLCALLVSLMCTEHYFDCKSFQHTLLYDNYTQHVEMTIVCVCVRLGATCHHCSIHKRPSSSDAWLAIQIAAVVVVVVFGPMARIDGNEHASTHYVIGKNGAINNGSMQSSRSMWTIVFVYTYIGSPIRVNGWPKTE